MSASPQSTHVPGQPGARFEPYVQLVRSLLPRTSSIAMFGPAGEMQWSTDTMTGPDLMNTVEDALLAARSDPGSAGQLRLLAGNLPVYLFALRDEAQQLLALLAIVCRANEGKDKRNHDFSFACSLVAPALECLRRELIARATIDELSQTVGGLDKDLSLLLAHGTAEQGPQGADGANELQLLLQQTIEHLLARTGALLVPEKGVMLVRSAAGTPPDTQFLMRAHRRLLTLAQGQREPILLNETLSADAADGFPYRVLCCPLRSRAGRSIGVLALLRDAGAEAFSARDAHIAEILARKAIGVIESNYDALSGLYTRPALERRVRAVVANLKGPQSWSALYINVDQLHTINEKFGMHVARRAPRPARRADPPAPAARGLRRAHLRRPLRRDAARGGERCGALRRVAARGHRAAGARIRARRTCRSRSASASRRSIPASRSSRTRSPPPRPPARRPRTAAATASRSTRRAM